jgi:Sulfotransferase domain
MANPGYPSSMIHTGLLRDWTQKVKCLIQNFSPSSRRRGPPTPNFFIVGAAKSGTTSLYQYLRQHPDIYMPAELGWKEPSYYCDTYGVANYEFYLSLFKDANTQKRIGEASTAYLSSPESARRIYDAVPDAKIIMVLRNPVDRAYSLYKWMFQHGYETISRFEEALEAEIHDRKDKPEFMSGKFYKGSFSYYWDFLYFSSGLYYEQVKRYYHLFPKGQMAVIIFEEFAKDTRQTVRSLYKFLGVDTAFDPEIQIHNQGAGAFSPLTEDTRHVLERKYLEDVARLSKLLKRDLRSIWFPDILARSHP